MRNPGRTAVTALALMIGVALVTAVTVVATGLKDESSGALERRVQATRDRHRRRRLVADRPARSSRDGGGTAACARTARSCSATRRASTASIPRRSGDFYRYDFTAGSLTADGALVDDGFATEHGLKVGSTLSVTSMSGKTLDLTVSGIEQSPVLDVLGLGPITISHAAFDATFEQERNRLTFADRDADAGAGRPSRTPRRRARTRSSTARRPGSG